MDGPFEWGMRIYGWERFLTLPVRDTGALEGFLHEATRLNRQLAGGLLEQGIDGVILADDLAYQKGLFTSPQVMRTRF